MRRENICRLVQKAVPCRMSIRCRRQEEPTRRRTNFCNSESSFGSLHRHPHSVQDGGKKVISSRDFQHLRGAFKFVFELTRRYKIADPEKMREIYGKLFPLSAAGLPRPASRDIWLRRSLACEHGLRRAARTRGRWTCCRTSTL